MLSLCLWPIWKNGAIQKHFGNNEQPLFTLFELDISSMVLEKTLENALDCKEIQPAHSEEDQSWDFFGRNDAKAETPVFWPPHAKSWLIGKDWCWKG